MGSVEAGDSLEPEGWTLEIRMDPLDFPPSRDSLREDSVASDFHKALDNGLELQHLWGHRAALSWAYLLPVEDKCGDAHRPTCTGGEEGKKRVKRGWRTS